MFDLDAWLRETTQRQHGLVAVSQALAAGASRYQIRHRLAGPEWALATKRVMRLEGSPRTDTQELKALVLDGGPGTTVSGLSAPALWRLPGFDFGPLHASRDRRISGRTPSVGWLRRPRALPEAHTTTVEGVEVLTLPATLLDIAPMIHAKRLERTIDTVTARSPAVLTSLHRLLEDFGASGRNGVGILRQLLAERPVGYLPPTRLERRFEKLLEEAGEPPMRRQVDLGGHEWIGRVDYVDDPPIFLVEVNSQTFHGAVLDVRADEERYEALHRAGFLEILPLEEEIIWHRPWEVPRLVRAGRARAAIAARRLAS